MGDITSANAILILRVDKLFPAGIRLQQFATDQSYASEQVQIAEARMGVDGVLAVGQTPNPKIVNITLEASSPSNKPLSALIKAMDINHRAYKCDLIATIPNLGIVMTWRSGSLVSGTPMPSGQKVLSPTSWQFVFQDFDKVMKQ